MKTGAKKTSEGPLVEGAVVEVKRQRWEIRDDSGPSELVSPRKSLFFGGGRDKKLNRLGEKLPSKGGAGRDPAAAGVGATIKKRGARNRRCSPAIPIVRHRSVARGARLYSSKKGERV